MTFSKIDSGIKLILSDLRSCDPPSTDRSCVSSNNVVGTDHPTMIGGGACAPDGDGLLTPVNGVNGIFNVTTFAYVGGLGFGVSAGLLAALNMLVALHGPGTLGYGGQPAEFVNLYAAGTLLVVLSNITFHVIVMEAVRQRSYVKIAAVPLVHLLQSGLTLATERSRTASFVVLAINVTICIGLCSWAFLEAGGSLSRVCWAICANVRRLRLSMRHCGGSRRSAVPPVGRI